MKKVMYEINEVRALIEQGKVLSLAGDEALLKQLPAGKWIGGTIPYFMAENGGLLTKDKIFVSEMPSYITDVSIVTYRTGDLFRVYKEAPEKGFSIIILPASSTAHLTFALNAPQYEAFATKPLIGWIAGVALDDLGKIKPKVFNGKTGQQTEDGAVVMHAELPVNKYADIGIVNIFQPGDGDDIQFLAEGFDTTGALINGEKRNFADYLMEKKADIRLPLVSDYCGVMVNTSFQGIDQITKKVTFYAPVFEGMTYKLAAPVGDYIKGFVEHMPSEDTDKIAFSCNCILNYLYSELEGKKTGEVTGPITFGEIAYQLLNQTMAYLVIGDI